MEYGPATVYVKRGEVDITPLTCGRGGLDGGGPAALPGPYPFILTSLTPALAAFPIADDGIAWRPGMSVGAVRGPVLGPPVSGGGWGDTSGLRAAQDIDGARNRFEVSGVDASPIPA